MRLRLFIDGASKGNPGRASIGAIIEDNKGEVLSELSCTIGNATNNQAEYRALVSGLGEVARVSGNRPETVDLVVKTDSELLYRQMTGRYRIKNKELMSLSLEARRKIERLGSFRLEHIPREQNKRADRLANAAFCERRP